MITRLSEVWPNVERVARGEGVARVGASKLDDDHNALFDAWLDRGHHATMQYLAKTAAIRGNPSARFPWAKSAIVILVPYSPARPEAPEGALSNHIARYALGDDYHDVLDGILRKIEAEVAPHGKTWRYVDTGPLSDRALATQAGLGWIAKNAMLINEQIGSYTFIGTLLTSLENDIEPDAVADRCGTCTRCLDACPTNAILPNRTVASEHCISYATIEHRGDLPNIPLASNAFGCDICQEVCPWNSEPAATHPAFAPRDEYRATPITDLLRYEQADFSVMFRKSAIKRAKLAGMQRNVAALTEAESRGMLKR
ncbi:MAG: tRNA epoxyqueuosine(34) reductase QueG [Acidobacteria bacterium]|nr:tRNA epoxyqueuosine(34) reductase QueG [Acidobacteriota bacterium]MBV9070203.1 tRNA epoxyqueuosine(34) reductase QueG [Acidobacteriota bacterium]MBV9184348.1 tRNA epoxyqueuosine(34) reductase QueG [Acidobacteriota bacterium]